MVFGGDDAASFPEGFPGGVGPSSGAVEGGEGEVGGGAALAADKFGAAADIVHHPGGESEVIGVSLDFTHVVGEGCDEVG